MDHRIATVAVCKCKETHKLYGVRFEKVEEGLWAYTWAFPIKEDTAKREGYDGTMIKGAIVPTKDYPGCPYCGSKAFVICECGKLNCSIHSSDTRFTCEWCGMTGELTAYEGDGIRSSGDS